MTRRKSNSVAFYSFRSRNYINSFGRNSRNTWFELPDKTRQKIRQLLEERDGLVCNSKHGHGCGRKMEAQDLSIDHVIPIRAGGPVVDTGNLQLLCYSCHNKKTFTIDIQYSNRFRFRSTASLLPKAAGGNRHRVRPGMSKV